MNTEYAATNQPGGRIRDSVKLLNAVGIELFKLEDGELKRVVE